jgi:hypothetical protein
MMFPINGIDCFLYTCAPSFFAGLILALAVSMKIWQRKIRLLEDELTRGPRVRAIKQDRGRIH